MEKSSLIVICKAIPFESGGAAAILRQLFNNTNKENKVILFGRKASYINSYDDLPHECNEIPLSKKSQFFVKKIFLFLYSFFIILKRVRKIKNKQIFGVFQDESSLILSYFTSLMLSVPLNIYLTDLYAEQNSSWFKRLIQKLIFKRSNNIFCITDAIKDTYAELYNINSIVIPHTIANINDIKIKNKQNLNNEFLIGYVGTIIPERIELLKSLSQIVNEKSNFKLRLFCPHNIDFIKQNNLYNESTSVTFIKDSGKLIDELHNCNLLYLPLSFEKSTFNKFDLQLLTCLGTKSFDYMQSGSEILIHCPFEYYTSAYFKKNNIGFLLNSSDAKDLSNTISLIYDEMKKKSFINSNYKNILMNHHSKTVYDKMIKIIFNEKK